VEVLEAADSAAAAVVLAPVAAVILAAVAPREAGN
jgi:hypothetical protein